MAESLDRLSGGRLMLGLGGGYSDTEFRAFGVPVPAPRQKVDGLEDAVRIARRLWTDRRLTYAGRCTGPKRRPSNRSRRTGSRSGSAPSARGRSR